MRNKKGYMLTESIVAIAIILLLTTFFISISLYVNSVYKKSTIISLGLTQIENIQTIFLASNFELESESINYENFENNLSFSYSNISKTETANGQNYTINFTEIFEQKANGKMIILISITNNLNNPETETKVCFFAKIYSADKTHFETPTTLEKAVI